MSISFNMKRFGRSLFSRSYSTKLSVIDVSAAVTHSKNGFKKEAHANELQIASDVVQFFFLHFPYSFRLRSYSGLHKRLAFFT